MIYGFVISVEPIFISVLLFLLVLILYLLRHSFSNGGITDRMRELIHSIGIFGLGFAVLGQMFAFVEAYANIVELREVPPLFIAKELVSKVYFLFFGLLIFLIAQIGIRSPSQRIE